jgi:hypothetical protein
MAINMRRGKRGCTDNWWVAGMLTSKGSTIPFFKVNSMTQSEPTTRSAFSGENHLAKQSKYTDENSCNFL